MKLVFVLGILVSMIFINNAFAQYTDEVDTKTADERYPLEITIIPAKDSSISGCENTADGCYIPKKVTMSLGGKIIFTNSDVVEHTFTAITTGEGTAGVFDSEIVNVGGSYEWIPMDVGEFPYQCMIHPWMEGIIIVEEKQSPPKDTDGDGIVDDLDSCPLQAETVNGLEDTDGCPDIVKKVNNDSILTYVVIGISIAGTIAIIGIKLHGKGSGEKSPNNKSNKRDDNQDSTPHVEVRITGGIEK